MHALSDIELTEKTKLSKYTAEALPNNSELFEVIEKGFTTVKVVPLGNLNTEKECDLDVVNYFWKRFYCRGYNWC